MTPAWVENPVSELHRASMELARSRQERLTKPPGSMGRLEALAIRLAGMQGRVDPSVERLHICVFAADHGVATAGVSAFPQEVTVQMLANFASGGAAISVLARHHGARLEVVDVGTLAEGEPPLGVLEQRAGAGTRDISVEDAMDPVQLASALDAGRAAAIRAVEGGAELYIGGDMGIGNTTAAAAVACQLLSMEPMTLAGPGTGLDSRGLLHKIEVLGRALARHPDLSGQPLEVLRCYGGFELVALAGAFLACAQLGLPVLVDGYITTAAALAVARLQPQARRWMIFSHRSAEPGHRLMLEALEAQPLLELEMRLGEGSGAATAFPLLTAACALHNGMATFDDAGISEGS